MNILAIDTSQPSGSVSIRTNDKDPETILFGTATSHLVEMGDAVAALLDRVGAQPEDIERVALVIGPGSFTGLRIGLAYVKGLFAALGMDVVAIGSLDLLTIPLLGDHDTVCPMVDARKSEVYAAVYRRGESPVAPGSLDSGYRALRRPHAVAPDKFLASLDERPVVFVGSGAVRFRSAIEETLGTDAKFAPDPFNQPSTAVLCRVGAVRSPLSKDEVSRLEPFYIRPSDATLSSLKRVRTHEQRPARPND